MKSELKKVQWPTRKQTRKNALKGGTVEVRLLPPCVLNQVEGFRAPDTVSARFFRRMRFREV